MPLAFFMSVTFLFLLLSSAVNSQLQGIIEGFVVMLLFFNLAWILVLVIDLIQNLIKRSWQAVLINLIGVGIALLLVGWVFMVMILPYA